jgi:hypothetical protein
MSDPNPWIAALVALESEVQYRAAPAAGEAGFRVQAGTTHVLVSAPHGAAHTRMGKIKEEDEYTAALARLTGRESGAFVLYTYRLSPDDANWDRDAPFKQALREVVATYGIRFILDLHGCAGSRPFGLALGTLSGRSCPGVREILLACLAEHGFHEEAPNPLDRLDIDRTFRAEGNSGAETITRFAWEELHVAAAQLEIHPALRIARRIAGATSDRTFEGDPRGIGRTLQALTAIVRRVEAAPLVS